VAPSAGDTTLSDRSLVTPVERWLDALLRTPGLTAVKDRDEAWRLHVEDALTALPLVDAGPVIDVGSGGGSPGIPLAAERSDLWFDLLESSRRKSAFLRDAAALFPNVGVLCCRAEEHAAGAGRDAYAVALARALAPPAVAAEWALPLVRPGGSLVLFAATPEGDLATVAAQLGAAAPEAVAGLTERRQLFLFRKLEPTPARFPRRPGVARKRPLR
jgi:16S rRNA (guanine527-N7)-methyltransferase